MTRATVRAARRGTWAPPEAPPAASGLLSAPSTTAIAAGLMERQLLQHGRQLSAAPDSLAAARSAAGDGDSRASAIGPFVLVQTLIKTIGDCYMAASGAPEPCHEHADRVVGFALRLLRVLALYNRDRSDG
eukprot:gene41582-5548_t